MQCTSIGECKDWSDKAEAMRSYARQAKDETMYKMAMRIQARAIRRCGDLLKTFRTGPDGGRPKNGTGDHTVSQRQAAKDAGLSKDQQVTAVRVANVPEEEFERKIDSDKSTTITKLAESGTKKRDWSPGTTSRKRQTGRRRLRQRAFMAVSLNACLQALFLPRAEVGP